ncbi:MAG: ThiF family adenylyltransferase, partial [Sulfuricaulis sp.]|nr:ThiF family adenylyltransferase [Sulfuricaulis sp.]
MSHFLTGNWPPPVDFSRHSGLLDHDLLARTHIACIGAGGAAGLVQILTRCGISTWTLVDPQFVDSTNPTTQAHEQIGVAKIGSLSRRLKDINPSISVTGHSKRYQELTEGEHAALWRADLVLAMTDDFHTQSAINRDAIRAGVDTVFAICYVGCEAVEITASFPDTIAGGGGCHRCHTKARYDAYDRGFRNPTLIAS